MKKIYVFKTTHRELPIEQMVEQDKNDEITSFSKAYDRWVKRLQKTNGRLETYINGIKNLTSYFTYPNVKLSNLGYGTKDGEPYIIPRVLQTVIDSKDDIILNFQLKCELEIETPDLEVEYLLNKEEDGFIWFTEELIDEALNVCNNALKSKKKAREILPSIDDKYDSEYQSNVRKFAKDMRYLKSLIDKKYIPYGVIC